MKTPAILFLSLIFVFTWGVCKPYATAAQPSRASDASWNNLSGAYKSGKITSVQYLASVDSLAMINIDDPLLKEHLQLYKEIVWANDDEKKRRRKYYYYLICNARINGQSGKVLYYVEKGAQDLKIKNAVHVVNVEKIQLFIGANDFQNVAAIYDRDSSFYNAIPYKIARGSYEGDPQSDLFLFYQLTQSFFDLKDSGRLFHVIQLAGKTYDSVAKFSSIGAWEKQMCRSYMQLAKCVGYQFQLKFDTAEPVLKEIQAFASHPPETSDKTRHGIFQQELLQHVTAELLNLYLAARNLDSARHYQQVAENFAGVNFVEDDIELIKSRSEIQALSGDYKAAFNTMKAIFKKTDTLLKRKTVEIAENVYAQAIAEDKKEEAETLAAEKRRLAIATIVGISFLLCVIALLYRHSKIKEERAKSAIDQLNQATGLQIAELEERGRILQQIQKKKLGLELHDGLAHQLANIKMLTETALYDSADPQTVDRLGRIKDLTAQAYEVTRNKSHEWYHVTDDQATNFFSEKIETIIAQALPARLYKQEVSLDDYHLNELPLESKIELMYIIQESLTNILKHAKADKVVLLIYEEADQLIYRISDNGKGIEGKLHKGIGLRGISDRAHRVRGTCTIISGKKGTELTVTIPLHI